MLNPLPKGRVAAASVAALALTFGATTQSLPLAFAQESDSQPPAPAPSDGEQPAPGDEEQPAPAPGDEEQPAPAPGDDEQPAPEPGEDEQPAPAPGDGDKNGPKPQDAVRFVVKFNKMATVDEAHHMRVINSITKEFNAESSLVRKTFEDSYVVKLDPPVPADKVPSLKGRLESKAEIHIADIDLFIPNNPDEDLAPAPGGEEPGTPAPGEEPAPGEQPAPGEEPAPGEQPAPDAEDQTPAEDTPGDDAPGESPVDGAPGEEAPGEETPGEDTPVDGAPGEEAPGEELPGEEGPGEGTPGEETPGEETPGEETPGDELPGEDNPGEELPGEETPGGDGKNPVNADVSNQWHMAGENSADVTDAWKSGLTGKGVNIAVVDSGITKHPNLDDHILPGYDMISDPWNARDGDGRDNNPQDEGDWHAPGQCGPASRGSQSSWHGAHVSGIAAASPSGPAKAAGVAPGAKILPVRSLGACGGYASDIADGIAWAAGAKIDEVPENKNPAQIINLSLGGDGRCSGIQQRAIEFANKQDALVVVAAGNENQNTTFKNPANCQGVLTVGATDDKGDRAFFSNSGSEVDVGAPGTKILSTWNTGTTKPGAPTYSPMDGTSMATPLVAGVAALIKEANPSLSADQVKKAIVSTATPYSGNASGMGSGIVDAQKAVASVGAGEGGSPSEGKGFWSRIMNLFR